MNMYVLCVAAPVSTAPDSHDDEEVDVPEVYIQDDYLESGSRITVEVSSMCVWCDGRGEQYVCVV